MLRRTLLFGIASLPVAGLWVRAAGSASGKGGAASPEIVALQSEWRKLLPLNAEVPTTMEPLKLSDEEWKKRLPPAAYHVLREEGTERPGSSPLDHEKRPGVFACAGCNLPLFTSAMKFDSGTGWPSFFTTIPGVFATRVDHKLILPRTEYHCVRCGGHHGHVFDDGPAPTNLRYCNNGVALRFMPKTA